MSNPALSASFLALPAVPFTRPPLEKTREAMRPIADALLNTLSFASHQDLYGFHGTPHELTWTSRLPQTFARSHTPDIAGAQRISLFVESDGLGRMELKLRHAPILTELIDGKCGHPESKRELQWVAAPTFASRSVAHQAPGRRRAAGAGGIVGRA